MRSSRIADLDELGVCIQAIPRVFSVYCDGSFNQYNHKSIATAVILQGDRVHSKMRSIHRSEGSHFAELKAAYIGLLQTPENSSVEIYSDSSFPSFMACLSQDNTALEKWMKTGTRRKQELLLRQFAEAVRRRIIEWKVVSRRHPLIRLCDHCCYEVNHRSQYMIWPSIKIHSRLIIYPKTGDIEFKSCD